MNEEDGMLLRSYGRGAVSDFLDNLIIYRSLNPYDQRLPGYVESAAAVGIQPGRLPRKHEDAYARVVVHQLEAARRLNHPRGQIRRLLYLGDTHLSDATAFRNLCRAGGWDGLAFIGSEERQRPAALLAGENEEQDGNRRLFSANRWALLSEFERQRQVAGFTVDEETVVVVDLDKTALGARGRNSLLIDQVRQNAVQETVAGLLGEVFDLPVFKEAYDSLNHPEFHAFTEDNQDFLAYVCLAVGSGMVGLEELLLKIRAKELVTFEQFIAGQEAQRSRLPGSFGALHADFYARLQEGDPTPFKAFRRSEYRLTAARLGFLSDDVSLAQILAEEIVITQEVYQAALQWKALGALIFGLSDKPDEASIPSPEQAAQGCLPLHRLETHIVGAYR